MLFDIFLKSLNCTKGNINPQKFVLIPEQVQIWLECELFQCLGWDNPSATKSAIGFFRVAVKNLAKAQSFDHDCIYLHKYCSLSIHPLVNRDVVSPE